ncbi:hypothetical protein AOLI_G00134280 [Acnodon oligacanthus]
MAFKINQLTPSFYTLSESPPAMELLLLYHTAFGSMAGTGASLSAIRQASGCSDTSSPSSGKLILSMYNQSGPFTANSAMCCHRIALRVHSFPLGRGWSHTTSLHSSPERLPKRMLSPCKEIRLPEGGLTAQHTRGNNVVCTSCSRQE